MPTRRGYVTGVIGVLLLAGGLAAGYPGLAALGGAAMIAVEAGCLYAGRVPSLAVRREVWPIRVPRGEPAYARVMVTAGGRRGSGRVLLSESVPGGHISVPVPRLRAGETYEVEYRLPTGRRGVVDIGPAEVGRRDPLGLAASTQRYGTVARLLVQPRHHALTGLPVGASRSLDGRVDAAAHGAITFAGLRPYVPGDDLRHIHWRMSARVGGLMVREHVDTSVPRMAVLLDDRATSYVEDDFEEAVEVAASVLVVAGAAGLDVGLHLVSGVDHPDWSRDRPLDVLAEVATASTDATPRQAVARLPAEDTVVVVTGGLADVTEIVGVRRHHRIAVLGAAPQPQWTVGDQPVIVATSAAAFAREWNARRLW